MCRLLTPLTLTEASFGKAKVKTASPVFASVLTCEGCHQVIIDKCCVVVYCRNVIWF